MMANQLWLRSPKGLAKIAEALKAEMRPFDLKRSMDDFGVVVELVMSNNGGLYPRFQKKRPN